MMQLFKYYCPHCEELADTIEVICTCGQHDWAPVQEYYGVLNSGPAHRVMHDLEKHHMSANPIVFMFDDPAIQRAYDCAALHISLLQGEYFARQYAIADDRGEL